MIVKLLTEHHLEFLSLKGGCRGSSESTLDKIPTVGNHVPRLNYKMMLRVPCKFAADIEGFVFFYHCLINGKFL